MSKTWSKKFHRMPKNTRPKPQKAISRLVMVEASRDIREALTAPQEAPRAN
jgi:hypothetical protein